MGRPNQTQDRLDALLDGRPGEVTDDLAPLLAAAEALRAELAEFELDPEVVDRHLEQALDRLATVQWSPTREAQERAKLAAKRLAELDKLVQLGMFRQVPPAIRALDKAVAAANVAFVEAAKGEGAADPELFALVDKLDAVSEAQHLELVALKEMANVPRAVTLAVAQSPAALQPIAPPVLIPAPTPGPGPTDPLATSSPVTEPPPESTAAPTTQPEPPLTTAPPVTDPTTTTAPPAEPTTTAAPEGTPGAEGSPAGAGGEGSPPSSIGP